MNKTIPALTGLLIFTAGILLYTNLANAEKSALKKTREKKGYGMIAGEFLPCSWKARPPEAVMPEDKSQAIEVLIKNETPEKCQSTVFLRAPGFDLSPMKEEQTIDLEASKAGSISWILTPRKTGSFEIAVTDEVDSKIFGITVKNIYGMTTTQAKTLSVVGSIFGPMFTVPWWWEKLRARKKTETQTKA